jgi:hypothetical protein
MSGFNIMYWITKEGIVWPIAEMQDSHIINTKRYFEAKRMQRVKDMAMIHVDDAEIIDDNYMPKMPNNYDLVIKEGVKRGLFDDE